MSTDAYSGLEVLGRAFGVDAPSVLEAVVVEFGGRCGEILEFKEWFGPFKEPGGLASALLSMGLWFSASIRGLLRTLGVGGGCRLEDLEMDFREIYFRFSFSGCGNPLIHWFDVTVERERATITTYTLLEGLTRRRAGRLTPMLRDLEEYVPENLYFRLHEYSATLMEPDYPNGSWTLALTCTAETLEDLPKIAEMQNFIMNILRRGRLRPSPKGGP